MKKNKFVYVLSTVLILGSLAFVGLVSANNNNDRSGEDNGNSWQAKEAHVNGSTLEVHIGDNGKVLVRGAKVTAISGNTISAFTSWGSVNLNWTVNVMSNSQMVRKFGGNSNLSEIAIGDYLSFQGTLVTTSSSPFVVNASFIKNWSAQKNLTVRTTIEGTLKSLVSVNSPTTMVVNSGNKDYTVSIATNTSVLNSLWLRAILSSFTIGDKVRVYGVVNTTSLTMDATVVRNVSLLK